MASGDLFDSVGEIVARLAWYAPAEVEHEVGPAVADEAALSFGEQISDDHRDQVVAETCSRFRRVRPVYSLSSRTT